MKAKKSTTRVSKDQLVENKVSQAIYENETKDIMKYTIFWIHSKERNNIKF